MLAAGALLAGRRVRGSARASLYALAAVATLAVQSSLLAATVALFEEGIVTAQSTWQPYAMGVVSFIALTLVQSAYQASPLAASMPVMDAANPIVGIAIGLALFDERVDLSGWHLLDTSPLVQRVQRIQDAERQASESRSSSSRIPAHRNGYG
ncbi:MAG: hypothetical protein QOJ06_2246 [Pseudonocardiales bacterium]|nr:hypothetical protein [Pseudonocardiales bacterium]